MALIEDARQQAPTAPAEGLSADKEQMVAEAYRLGKNILYRKDVFDTLIQQMGDAQPPAALAEAIVFILEKIQSDMKMPFDALFAAGLALMADLADALTRTGRFEFTEEDVSKAVEMGIYMYLSAHGQEFDKNELMSQYEQGVQTIGAPPAGGM